MRARGLHRPHDAETLRGVGRSAREHRWRAGFAGNIAPARGEGRGGRPRRCAVAAALPQDGGRAEPRGALAREIAAKSAATRLQFLQNAAKMPLIVVANSPNREAALAGLERWKISHAEAAKLLAIDDVLIDSMRGRSSTWTRIRINLRHVPEAIRPAQETPDPDDDPTREWRTMHASKKT